MPQTKFKLHPDTPFPIGVEYYRAPIPKQDLWDEDFAKIREAGFRIVRSFSFWNWMEPEQGVYELDDFDLFFDLAEKHDLYVYLDITLATHGSCPDWLERMHPDIRAVTFSGDPQPPSGSNASPQGKMFHCYDHPAWKEHGSGLLRHVVGRYKDRPNLLIWGLWDGISPVRPTDDLPCYCHNTLARYKAWLMDRFTLDEVNERFLQRYRNWEDVQPPRTNTNVVEMMMYRRFHNENLADHLKWMVSEAKSIDPNHEMRAHAAWLPRPWDEHCAPHVDSWGMSMPSNNLLTSDDPYKIAERAFAFDLSRSLGANGRWWNEEIYSGMSPGGVMWKKQSDPHELTTLMWMTLASGAAGTLFWQYRPEYLSFESPGYNLTALDGLPTPRLEAVTAAIRKVDGMSDHLPLECPRSEIGIVYHSESQELFGFNQETERFIADLRGVYRTLWSHGFPADIVTPSMDWSGYRLLILPNVALMADEVRERIERTLEENPETRIVAEGSFGFYSADGQSSYNPPEGFANRFGVRVADLSALTEKDIREGRNDLATSYGALRVSTPCGYAVLEALGTTESIATMNGATVGVRTADRRFTWFGLSLSAGFGDVADPNIVLGLAKDAGIDPPVAIEGDRAVPFVRKSRQGGWLVFVFNIENNDAKVTLRPGWQVSKAVDLFLKDELAVVNGRIDLNIPTWEVAVIYFE